MQITQDAIYVNIAEALEKEVNLRVDVKQIYYDNFSY